MKGKAECKLALQRAMGLQEDPYIPLIGCVSRLVGHKGFSLVTDALHDIMAMNVQMVVLGTGDWQYEAAFREAQVQYPGRFAARIQYSAPLSSAIYGGADLFLMPSISEPCGLSQMIAMRYGTVPVVRETGGLKDTVTPTTSSRAPAGALPSLTSTPTIWSGSCGRQWTSISTTKRPGAASRREDMTADFSWNSSARQYLEIYQRILGW